MLRYGIATILEDHAVGREFTVNDLPLHLTIVDSFIIDLEADELAVKLQAALKDQKVSTVKALQDEKYGPDSDIAVNALELTPRLKTLHDKIMDFLKNEDAILRNPQFNSDNFSPHISVYSSKRVNHGDIIEIKDVSITAKVSEAEDANRRILANIKLN